VEYPPFSRVRGCRGASSNQGDQDKSRESLVDLTRERVLSFALSLDWISLKRLTVVFKQCGGIEAMRGTTANLASSRSWMKAVNC
jgi:hypothetical protein